MPPRFRILDNADFFFEEPDCRLYCRHCSHGIKRGLQRTNPVHRFFKRLSGLASLVARPDLHQLDEFESRVADLPESLTDPVCLSGYDVLEVAELLDLLEICRRRGRKVRIISPGLKLADPLFAQKLADYQPEIILTYLSRSPETYARMTGHPQAQQLVERALQNLRELDANVSVNFVATSDNSPELSEVAAFLFDEVGIDALTLLYFFPDWVHFVLDARTTERFARFEQLNRQLLEIAQDYQGSDRRVCLWGVPPCKLDPEVLQSGNIAFSVRDSWDESYRTYRHPNCDSCRFADKCFFVSSYYHEAYPHETFGHEKVNRLFSSLIY